MPKESLEDLHASIKVGGYFVTAFRSHYWVNGQVDGFKDKLDEMIAEGKFVLVDTYEFERGFSKEGVPEEIMIEFKTAIDRFQMGKSILTIFKKTS